MDWRRSDASLSSARRPILCLVTDRRAGRGPLPGAVAAALAGGVDWVQVREKDLSGTQLLELCDAIRDAAAAYPEARVLVNRRLDVALAGALDGVHLGFDGLPPGEARALLGDGALVGIASHRSDELLRRAESGASYAHLAPIFPPLSKSTSRPPLGLRHLEEAARVGVPLLAQGGITRENAAACIRAGARGIAVTGALLDTDDPAASARGLRAALDSTMDPTATAPAAACR